MKRPHLNFSLPAFITDGRPHGAKEYILDVWLLSIKAAKREDRQ